jgi:hypothetical protein
MMPYNVPAMVPQSSIGMPVPPMAAPSAPMAPLALIPQTSVGNAQVMSSYVEPVKAKRLGKCWKCAMDNHASKDCTVQHYCLVCNNAAHPTIRCPTLKLLRPSSFFYW